MPLRVHSSVVAKIPMVVFASSPVPSTRCSRDVALFPLSVVSQFLLWNTIKPRMQGKKLSKIAEEQLQDIGSQRMDLKLLREVDHVGVDG
ncbi:hypothetical protein Ae201684P_001810 [Aphanomyces euteiches]|uniref:Uncharacterized protein n=1 Tax=Aphanomyces euteiches TaxID=100861 RepID=A0A6G0XK30_9STRA|nr:hypothetical protein Ae201684_003864 [Aphanomyces euteiches]KAH9084568.1 hypothetical protein Ae201684P_001810 [Aphanomyces euteiches]